MKITPFFIGSGRAAAAMEQALGIVSLQNKEWDVGQAVKIKRGEKLFQYAKSVENPVLFIANPHALHAPALLEAEESGFKFVFCEKPAAVNKDQIRALQSVRMPVAIFHGYRQMWGVQKIRSLFEAKEFGKIVAIEGRYWQSSAAQRSVTGLKADPLAWKNNTSLSGTHDALIDIVVHWVDAAAFVVGKNPKKILSQLSYVNAESPHRDTHVFVEMDFEEFKARSSVSKTVHGAANHFEISVLGEKKAVTWNFMDPDTLVIGEGAVTTRLPRTAKEAYGAGHPPYHGTGWLEGYIEIIRAGLAHIAGAEPKYPQLGQHLDLLELLIP